MRKILKWVAITLAGLFVVGFLGFLYFIPPFDLLPREEFIKPYAEAIATSLDKIDDPVTRMLAERGRYIITFSDCNGCHTPNGDQGPNWKEYLAGGIKFSWKKAGTSVSRNLTPDPETGLGRRTDEEVKRVLRSGVFRDGRLFEYTFMPWAGSSNMSEEDRHAIVVYLRHVKPVKHKIPDWSPNSTDGFNSFYPADYAEHATTK